MRKGAATRGRRPFPLPQPEKKARVLLTGTVGRVTAVTAPPSGGFPASATAQNSPRGTSTCRCCRLARAGPQRRLGLGLTPSTFRPGIEIEATRHSSFRFALKTQPTAAGTRRTGFDGGGGCVEGALAHWGVVPTARRNETRCTRAGHGRFPSVSNAGTPARAGCRLIPGASPWPAASLAPRGVTNSASYPNPVDCRKFE